MLRTLADPHLKIGIEYVFLAATLANLLLSNVKWDFSSLYGLKCTFSYLSFVYLNSKRSPYTYGRHSSALTEAKDQHKIKF